MNMKRFFILLGVVFLFFECVSQVPNEFAFQAVVRNAANQLVANSPVSVRVSIIQGGVMGNAVYVETHNVTTNENGLMTFYIGSGSVLQGTLESVDWGNGVYYLKTETDSNGGSDYSVVSTQQLVSVPYALYAKEAESSADCQELSIALQGLLSIVEHQQAQIDSLISNSGSSSQDTTPAAPVDGQACPGMSTVTDYDGNIYNTVQIGNQCWLRENLRTTHYADGTVIPVGGNSTSSVNPYYYLPLDIQNLFSYGVYYNWVAATRDSSSLLNPSGVQGVCPAGWHVPSMQEWLQLNQYVSGNSQYYCGGSSANTAKALASADGWDNSSEDCSPGDVAAANNSTGFSAVPAGGMWVFSGGVQNATFWSTSQSSAASVHAFVLQYSLPETSTTVESMSHGCSIRCVRN